MYCLNTFPHAIFVLRKWLFLMIKFKNKNTFWLSKKKKNYLIKIARFIFCFHTFSVILYVLSTMFVTQVNKSFDTFFFE